MNNSINQNKALRESYLFPNIFFGPEIWPLQSQGGISRYNGELIKGIASINQNTFSFLPNNRNQFIDLIPDRCKILTDQTNTSELIETALSKIGKERHNSIYHATYFGNTDLKLWQRAGFKTVITVHDLISEKFPEKKISIRPRINLKRKAIQLADHIICISQTTKIDLMDYYDINENKISVVYHGSDLKESETEILDLAVEGKFLLYVGKRGGYKNFNFLLKAFANSGLLKENFCLIAFGGEEFDKSEFATINSLGILKNVSHLSGDDALLSKLYGEAHALIYPSLYEGFGLPPIEAMKLGCLVIASNKGSIPEICQDAALYFDPNDIRDLVGTIEKTIHNPKLNREKIQSGLLLSTKYTWEQTALQTQQIYADVSTRM